jgi:ABC-type lipoprotein release transport system permease subunit
LNARVAEVVFCVRAQLRARRAAWALLAILIGLSGAVVMVAAAGARRTDSAYTRYLTTTHAADLLLSPDQSGVARLYADLARIPGSDAVAPVIGYGTAPVGDPHQPLLVDAAMNDVLGHRVEHPLLTQGRLPDPNAPYEVVADRNAAHVLGLHAGSTIRVAVARAEEELPDFARDPIVTLSVVGIGTTRDSVVNVNALASQPSLIAGPAFTRRFGPAFYAFDGAYVKLHQGESKAAFISAAQAVARRYPQTGGGFFAADESQQAARVESAIRPQAIALALFALLTALTVVVAVGQVVARQVHAASSDSETLAGLGMVRRRRAAVVGAQVALAAVAGAFIACVVSILASPLMPIGPARVAEPHPGVAIDWSVLLVGFAAIIFLTIAVAIFPVWRGAAVRVVPDAGASRRSTLGDAARRAGVPASVSIGIGHATGTSGPRSALPTRSALVGTVVAVAAISGALTFGVNLARFVDTPRLYGQSWDVTADAQFSTVPASVITKLLAGEPGVVAWTWGEHGDVTVDGHSVAAIGLVPGRGELLSATAVEGRAPAGAGEIALGAKTLASAHGAIGHVVKVGLEGSAPGAPKPVAMPVVGRAVFPFFGRGSFTPTGLGIGAEIRERAAGTLNPGQDGYNFVLVRVADGPQHDAEVARVVHDLVSTDACGLDNQCQVTTAARPVDVLNYSRVRATPLLLAAVLAFLATLAVGYLLITSVRRHRRDFAVLRTFGFTRAQVMGAVAAQATTVAIVALVVGLPCGVLLGRLAWDAFTHSLAVPNNAVAPVLGLVVAIPIAVLLANLLAAGPGLIAARLRPADALRRE